MSNKFGASTSEDYFGILALTSTGAGTTLADCLNVQESTDEPDEKTETDAIEMCLDHFERDPIRGTYNQAEHMDVRAEIMQVWADELDQERIRFEDQRDRVLIPQALPQTQKPKQSGVVVS
jgi:hypothetical protein